ncbi:MAG: dockerin type I repeat-containing protein [Oscillospiraceae bacterium]|nr:dockerin type I repeat-containing protein [Oscillospiraceae bacterium]
MKKRIISSVLALTFIFSLTITASASTFPYELKGPFANDEWNYWRETPEGDIPAGTVKNAERVVVEYTGTLTDGFRFSYWAMNWTEYNPDNARITDKDGIIIFDIRGLSEPHIAFAAWGAGNAAKITKVYLDTWVTSAPAPEAEAEEPEEAAAEDFTTADALTILRAAAGMIELTAEQTEKYDLNGDGEITTADAILVLRLVAGVS